MKLIALTFDDSPTAVTEKIVEAAEKFGVRLTLFCEGQKLNENSSQILKKALKLGCEIGNHSFSHPALVSLDDDEIKKEISSTTSLIEKYAGVSPRLVRAPYGAADERVLSLIDYPFMNWNVDTLDWDEKTTCEYIISSVLDNASDGSVVLMHSIYEKTAQALETIIPALLERGFELMTVSEMYKRKGEELLCKKLYP